MYVYVCVCMHVYIYVYIPTRRLPYASCSRGAGPPHGVRFMARAVVCVRIGGTLARASAAVHCLSPPPPPGLPRGEGPTVVGGRCAARVRAEQRTSGRRLRPSLSRACASRARGERHRLPPHVRRPRRVRAASLRVGGAGRCGAHLCDGGCELRGARLVGAHRTEPARVRTPP